MTLLDLNFTSYIPTTVLGLLGLLFAYLYGYYRNRDNNKLEQLKTIRTSERSKVMEMLLNDLGVQIDTSTLNPKQKFELVVKLLSAKTKKYLIISITLILLSLIIAFLIWSNYHLSTVSNPTNNRDTVSKSQGETEKVIIHDTFHQITPIDSHDNSKNNEAVNNTKLRQSTIDPNTSPPKKQIKEFNSESLNQNILGEYQMVFTGSTNRFVNSVGFINVSDAGNNMVNISGKFDFDTGSGSEPRENGATTIQFVKGYIEAKKITIEKFDNIKTIEIKGTIIYLWQEAQGDESQGEHYSFPFIRFDINQKIITIPVSPSPHGETYNPLLKCYWKKN